MNATKLFLSAAMTFSVAQMIQAQPTPERKPDVSNKALITKSAPNLGASKSGDPATLRKLADDYYTWRNENYPVRSSDSGLHTWDDRLTDYSPAKVAARAQHVRALLDQVRSMPGAKWPKDDRIDWMLFRSQLEAVDFGNRVMKSDQSDPQTYVGECVSGIFSLLKKEYDTPEKRALSATARLKQMPAMLAQGTSNLKTPVKLRAARDRFRAFD